MIEREEWIIRHRKEDCRVGETEEEEEDVGHVRGMKGKGDYSVQYDRIM